MVLCDRNSIIKSGLPLNSQSPPQQPFVANYASVFTCPCYRLSSHYVHLYVNFTPVILQHRNVSGHKYEYALV